VKREERQRGVCEWGQAVARVNLSGQKEAGGHEVSTQTQGMNNQGITSGVLEQAGFKWWMCVCAVRRGLGAEGGNLQMWPWPQRGAPAAWVGSLQLAHVRRPQRLLGLPST